ncbi:hypothetical protein BGX26_003309 [Mortierella sp. AD094]|nr:hypothetical protein BGX26_003309 [Mortierella sp. AD094]
MGNVTVHSLYISVGDVLIQRGDNIFCDMFFDGIYIPGYIAITDKVLGEYFEVGVVAPTLQVWDDPDGAATGLAIEECLKNTIMFGYDISGPYLLYPLYLLAAFSISALLMVVVFRAPPSSGPLSYYVGALGALINTEPLNDGLTIELWRSEAAGSDNSALPLADRDTTAQLQLGSTPEKGDENILYYGMFKDQAHIDKKVLKAAIITGDIAYTEGDAGGKKIVIASLRSAKNSYGRIIA